MKRTVCICLLALLVALSATGCAQKQTASSTTTTDVSAVAQTTQNTQAETMDVREAMDAFVPPAKACKIDLSLPDPSNEQIRFVLDEEGRIDSCYYDVGDYSVIVSYSYSSENVHVFAFIGSFVVDDTLLDVQSADYDPSAGFSSVGGYFVKGFAV